MKNPIIWRSVEELWAIRDDIVAHHKKASWIRLYETMPEVILMWKEGKEFTDAEIMETRYFKIYLLNLYRKDDKGASSDRTIKHQIKKFREYQGHCQSIIKEGIKNPIEFTRSHGKTVLLRGHKRLTMAHALGIEQIATRDVAEKWRE